MITIRYRRTKGTAIDLANSDKCKTWIEALPTISAAIECPHIKRVVVTKTPGTLWIEGTPTDVYDVIAKLTLSELRSNQA